MLSQKLVRRVGIALTSLLKKKIEIALVTKKMRSFFCLQVM